MTAQDYFFFIVVVVVEDEAAAGESAIGFFFMVVVVVLLAGALGFGDVAAVASMATPAIARPAVTAMARDVRRTATGGTSYRLERYGSWLANKPQMQLKQHGASSAYDGRGTRRDRRRWMTAVDGGRTVVLVQSTPRPFTRETWQFDSLVAVLIGALQVGLTTLAGRHQPNRYPIDGLAVVLLLVGPAALLLRRRYPVAVLAVCFVSTLAYVVVGYPRGPIFGALIVAFFTTRLRGHRTAAWISIAVGWPAFLWLARVLGRAGAPSLGEIFGLAAWLLVLATTAEVVAIRRAQAAEAERMHREEMARRASEERLQIAQELHDVLAHNISLISVQAGVGLHLLDQQPEQARAALTAIKEASQAALGELRSVLDVLRRDDASAPRVPAPALTSDLDGLVSKAKSAGIEVGIETSGERRALPPGVDRAAFRIAQEALTNVTRHAGGARARLRVSYGDEELTLEIVDDRSSPSSAKASPTTRSPNGFP